MREEALVNNSRAGIIYGHRGGGTLREIFQDVERNYSYKRLGEVTPIIFFDVDVRTTNSSILPSRERPISTCKTRTTVMSEEMRCVSAWNKDPVSG
ncbi:hypothetical protein [Bradyrhizobium quebecense]|uniref:Uncharacterized protein n=2 Tax=Bradyrhizobium quebecense TaxID=2748629 RepID=A0ABS3MVQ5_9BRAD|nr:hypothetical protein [Bradyrhizobium quebecense]UGY07430.1 hypothetical protein J4P68_0040350 [Bradyrhizobium quebecense]